MSVWTTKHTSLWVYLFHKLDSRAAKSRPKAFEQSNLLKWNIVCRAVIMRKIQWQNAFHRKTNRSMHFAVFTGLQRIMLDFSVCISQKKFCISQKSCVTEKSTPSPSQDVTKLKSNSGKHSLSLQSYVTTLSCSLRKNHLFCTVILALLLQCKCRHSWSFQ